MPKVSLIIPVYNVENYIEKCLDSVINQTLKDIEIIIVNDGSKDTSKEKIEKYLKKIFTQENFESAAYSGRKVILVLKE